MSDPVVIIRVKQDRYSISEAQVCIANTGDSTHETRPRRIRLQQNLDTTIPALYRLIFDRTCLAVQEYGGAKMRLDIAPDSDWYYEVAIVARVVATEFKLIVEGFSPKKRPTA